MKTTLNAEIYTSTLTDIPKNYVNYYSTLNVTYLKQSNNNSLLYIGTQ